MTLNPQRPRISPSGAFETGATPGTFYQTVDDNGTPLPQEPALNIVNGLLADNPGAGSTDLTLQYQTVLWGSEAVPQEPAINFSFNDFTVADEPGTDTRVSLARPLPSVGAGDAGDVLAVSAIGTWAAAANAFLSFNTTTGRDSYAGLRREGMLVYVTTTQCLYMLGSDLTTWRFFAPSPALASQAAWALDVGAGSDNNSGLPGFPLASIQELNRRLCPGGAVCLLKQLTTLTVAAGSYGELQLNFGNSAFPFKVVCAISSSAPITLSAVVASNNVTQTRGELTTLAGAFVSKRRIRSTSGANVGAICYSTGLVAANPLHTFVTEWTTHAGAVVAIANGTTVVVDTLLVSFSIVNITFNGEQTFGGFFEFNDAFLHGGNLSEGAYTDGWIRIVGCELDCATTDWNGSGDLIQCRWVSGGFAYRWVSGTCRWYGTVLQNDPFIVENGYVILNAGCSLDGGRIGAEWNASMLINSSFEIENGPANTAIVAAFGGNVEVGGKVWSPTASYTYVFELTAGGRASTSSTALLGASGTTNYAILNSEPYAVGEIPVAVPESGVYFGLNSDVVAVSSLGVALSVTAAARGNLGPSNLFAANPRKGMYRFQVYQAVTVAGTLGPTCQVNVIFTDDSGVARTVAVTSKDITVVGGIGGEILIETNGATQVQWSVTGVTTQGALQYSIRINCRIESAS